VLAVTGQVVTVYVGDITLTIDPDENLRTAYRTTQVVFGLLAVPGTAVLPCAQGSFNKNLSL
jgi:hypothetical protein